jgi:uncharacterized protein (TIGR03663 family)
VGAHFLRRHFDPGGFQPLLHAGGSAISHDESIHTNSRGISSPGRDFQHNPMMHGPLLFEVTALNYFMFGVNDFTSRIYTAALGVLLVLTPVLFRKWLGKPGAALAAVMLLISPSISYYARYIRHDTPVMLFAVLWIWTLFQYLDTGKKSWLYGMAAFFSLMHASKEVNYIYIAIVCGLMAFPFAWQVMTLPWQRKELFQIFVFALIAMLLLLAVFAASFLVADVQHQIWMRRATRGWRISPFPFGDDWQRRWRLSRCLRR